MSNSPTTVETACAAIYAETARLYETLARQVTGPPHGWKILGGPPYHRPPLMFIGYQPGGTAANDAEEHQRAQMEKWPVPWPQESEFAVASWPLATQLRSIFGTKLLRSCVSLNAIFLRFPSADAYRAALDASTRKEVEVYCVAAVRRLIRAIEPERIIILGLGTADLFGPSADVLNSTSGRTLARGMLIEGVSATATIHLTGAQISGEDRSAVARFLSMGDRNSGIAEDVAMHTAAAPTPHDSARTSHRTGPYRIGNLAALRRRATNRADPRWIFYDAMLRLNRYENYYASLDHLKVHPDSYQSRPRTAHTEMAWARKQGWIVDTD